MNNSLVSHLIQSFLNVKEYLSNFVIIANIRKYLMSNGF